MTRQAQARPRDSKGDRHYDQALADVIASGVPLPHDDAAEAAVLGAILLDNDALDAMPIGFSPADFYRTGYRLLFEIFLELRDMKRPVDQLTVLERARESERVVDPTLLNNLANQVPLAAHAPEYARIVMDTALRRALIFRLNEALAIARDETVATAEVQLRAEQKLATVQDRRRVWTTAKDAAMDHMDDVEAAFEGRGRRAFKTGIVQLDRELYVQDTDFGIVGGRPGDGKSTLLWRFARRVAAQEGPVLFVPLEMTRSELAMRAAMDMASLRVEDARKPRSDEAAKKLSDAIDEFSRLPITFVEDPDPLVILREAARAKRKLGIRAVFIDYAQLVRVPREWGENRDQRIGEMTRRLRAFAKDEQVPIVAAAQLKRRDHLQRGQDPRPSLDDLRESGNFEQDATFVLFIYRPGKVDGTDEHKRGDLRTTELIVAKQRGGRADFSAHVAAEFEHARFVEPEQERQDSMGFGT